VSPQRPPSVGILSQEKVRERSVRELNVLINKLEKCIVDVRQGKCEFKDVEKILEDIDLLQVDVKLSANIIGRLSPWKPELMYEPEPVNLQNFQLAIRGLNDSGNEPRGTGAKKIRFPQLRKAIEWLIRQGIATAEEFAEMSAKEQQETFSAPGINSRKTLEKLRNTIATSLQAGESLDEFRKRLDPDIGLLRHEEETIYRTKTKSAYVEGLETTLDKPGVRDRFQWVMFVSTDDNRVRDHHWDLDGKIAKRGSTLHKIMLAVLKEWNCRCSIIPLNERQMIQRGGESRLSELPTEFRQEFDMALI